MQFVHSVVRTAVLCTDMLFENVVHVSRARAVLRFALLRFASRTALGIHSFIQIFIHSFIHSYIHTFIFTNLPTYLQR